MAQAEPMTPEAEPMTPIEEISKLEKVVEESCAVMMNHLREQKSKLRTSPREIPLTMLKQLQLTNISTKIEGVTQDVLKINLQIQDWNRLLNSSHIEHYNAGVAPVTGITIHNNEVYMISNKIPHILVYRLQDLSKVFRQISVPDLTYATGLVYNESNLCLYASNWSDPGRIYKININTDDSFTDWATRSSEPLGLSISQQKNLLVSYRNCGQIDEFNGLGQLIRNIVLTDGITGINHSIELRTGEFIVCQCHPLSRIRLVNSSGEVIKSYGREGGSVVEQLNNPHHVELDQRGNILISDCENNRLRVLTSDLTYVADVNISVKELYRPACTYWDKENDVLFVSTWFADLFVITPE